MYDVVVNFATSPALRTERKTGMLSIELTPKAMLTIKEKERVIKKFHLREGDTGSTEVQVALFTEEIKRLTKHLKTHPKDHSSRRGLLKMVSKRKRLMDYLKDTNIRRHNKVAKALKL